jgi:hypothetical protein
MKITDINAALDPQFEKVDTPRTNNFAHNIGNDVDGHYVVDIDFARQLERELAEAQAEITRLKGEAESWEKVFDRTCEHLADAKTELAEAKEQLRLCNVDQFTTAAELAEAVAAERERCARVCDEMDESFVTIYGTDYTDFQNDPRYLQMAADAIRKGE